MASDVKGRGPEVGVRRTRLMGPLRRDGFLLNAEPLAHVRSFHIIPGRPFFPICLSLSLSSLSARPHQSANHNFYQSHLRVTIADNRWTRPDAFCLPPGFGNNALEQFCHAHHGDHRHRRWSFFTLTLSALIIKLNVARLNSS